MLLSWILFLSVAESFISDWFSCALSSFSSITLKLLSQSQNFLSLLSWTECFSEISSSFFNLYVSLSLMIFLTWYSSLQWNFNLTEYEMLNLLLWSKTRSSFFKESLVRFFILLYYFFSYIHIYWRCVIASSIFLSCLSIWCTFIEIRSGLFCTVFHDKICYVETFSLIESTVSYL